MLFHRLGTRLPSMLLGWGELPVGRGGGGEGRGGRGDGGGSSIHVYKCRTARRR